MTGAERDLFHILSNAERRVAQRLATVLDAAGCSVEQWRVLTLLEDGHGHPMTELAEFALLPAPTTTKLVDRMVADNLVYRRADPADRRRVLVYLAERGRHLHTRLSVPLRQLQSELLEQIGDTGEFTGKLARLAVVLDPAPATGREI
ncbi:MAG TPA: MarR family transcriptional regulator [Amycolatopsis sp.]|nr:MarR family transcriptional regulator [Amycolatopsis sp.]